MGVGKTTVCRKLYTQLENAVWLDGDWCWMMHPFVASEENKQMVQENIHYILRNYLKNSSLDYIIFNWVIHQEEIFELILNGLQGFEFEVYKITLLCDAEELEKRMLHDGRKTEIITESLLRIELYKKMDTLKINTTNLTIDEVVGEISKIIHPSHNKKSVGKTVASEC